MVCASRELFAYVRYVGYCGDESGVQFLCREGRQFLVAGLVLLDGGDNPPTRGTAMLACAPGPLAHISDNLKYILE